MFGIFDDKKINHTRVNVRSRHPVQV